MYIYIYIYIYINIECNEIYTIIVNRFTLTEAMANISVYSESPHFISI